MIVHGHRPTHLLHLLLSVFTLGLWLLVWLLLAGTVRERYKLSTVDALGNVRSTRLGVAAVAAFRPERLAECLRRMVGAARRERSRLL
jgi:hypothetical protein